MSDFNSVPSASENMYGDQGKGDSNSGAQNRPAETGDPAIDEENRRRMKRKGDREAEEREEEKKKEQEKGKKNNPEEKLKEQVTNPQKLMKNIKNLQLLMRFAQAAQKVQQVVATALRVTAVVAQAIIAIITAIVTAICAVLLAWLFGDVTESTTAQRIEAPIALVNRAGTGRGEEEFVMSAAQREVARNIYSVMRAFKVADDPSGAKAMARGDGESWTDTGASTGDAEVTEGEPRQIAVGLRPDRIFAMIGNFNRESSLDVTAVETISDEPFMLGRNKTYFIEHDFVAELCANTPDRKAYFEENSTIHRVGIGLAQWTDVVEEGAKWDWKNPGRNYKLVQYARLYSMENAMDPDASHPNWLDLSIDPKRTWAIIDNNTESLWYDQTVQMAYMLDLGEVGDDKASWLHEWASDKTEEQTSTRFPNHDVRGDVEPWHGDKSFEIENDLFEAETRKGYTTCVESRAHIEPDIQNMDETGLQAIGEHTHDVDHWTGADSVVVTEGSTYVSTEGAEGTEDTAGVENFDPDADYVFPLAGYDINSGIVTSEFNPGRVHPITGQVQAHKGIDLGVPNGTQIISVKPGRVSYVGYDRQYDSEGREVGYGWWVEIDHGNGITTRYAHLRQRPNLTVGQPVDQGSEVGRVGSTGGSTGNHLHFEYRVNGQAVNPRVILGGAVRSGAVSSGEDGSVTITYHDDSISNVRDEVDEYYSTTKEVGPIDAVYVPEEGADNWSEIGEVIYTNDGGMFKIMYGDREFTGENAAREAAKARAIDRAKWCYDPDLNWDLIWGALEKPEDLCTCDHDEGEGSGHGTCPEGCHCDAVDAANELLRNAYINCIKYYYRKYLYEGITAYYTAIFLKDYEGVAGNAYQERIGESWDPSGYNFSALGVYAFWWDYADMNDYAEPNIDLENREFIVMRGASSEFQAEVKGNKFDDRFFFPEQPYAHGIVQAIDYTQDELYAKQKTEGKVYAYDEVMATGLRTSFIDSSAACQKGALIAWPNKDASYNEGTELYKYIADHVIGDGLYMSCDRGVCTAVRWSGLDDNFPPGDPGIQLEYLESSPNWSQIPWGGDVEMLEPGDVLVRKDTDIPAGSLYEPDTDHHIVMYIGPTYAKWYGLNGLSTSERSAFTTDSVVTTDVIMHASAGERSAGLDSVYSDLRRFQAFRCTKPKATANSRYVRYMEP